MTPEPWQGGETFAAYSTRCETCDCEVQALTLDANGKSVIVPCWHPARIILKLNPRLAAA